MPHALEPAPEKAPHTAHPRAVHEIVGTPAGVARLIDHAVELGASDLFFSAESRDATAVSVRHLGVIVPLARVSADYGRHCAAHLCAEAGLDVPDHRRPHDGRYTHTTAGGRTVDLRVCSMPTLYGEDVSVRILDRATVELPFHRLGLGPADEARLTRLLDYPSGLILVTGPTGSGKTTTLYACLRHLNTGRRRVHTIEDPIEYALPGVHQSQPQPKLGLHFPDILRGILRQGPDVIMIGEIRDAETAQTAVTAANSGHLVLATLHAPVAAGAVASMLAYGVAPHFLASSLIGAVAQRLVRTFCRECRCVIEGEWVDEANRVPRYGALGCPVCHDTGFGGRTALFQVMPVTRATRELIQSCRPAHEIEEQARRDGMTGFLAAARAVIARGETDMTEVRRCVPPDCLREDEPG